METSENTAKISEAVRRLQQIAPARQAVTPIPEVSKDAPGPTLDRALKTLRKYGARV